MRTICTSLQTGKHTNTSSLNFFYGLYALPDIISDKVMISGERQKVRQKAVRWPCGVCSKGVGSNSLECTSLPEMGT